MPPFRIDQLYDYMSPKGALITKGVTKQNSLELLENLLMGEVYMYSFDKIKQVVAGGVDAVNDPDMQHVHGIGSEGPLFREDSYFSSANVKSSNEFLPSDLQSKKKLSVFVSRNPFVTAARRSTNDVDFFLNYTPSVFASQLVPYLDVELQVTRPPVSAPDGSSTFATNITSPNLMRFLMGSVPINDPKLGVAGRAVEIGQDTLQNVSFGGEDKKVDTVVAYSGMEMFLAPQTLTNMDELKGGNGRRLVDVKPFLPFASIEGMDVSFANAGAGTMIHKKGTLRLKIHDKARVAEMAPFLKPGGFAYVNVITTYGWIAPDRGDDVYAAFINEKMMSQDTWMVSNSSYSFDSSGQVSIILELVSLGYRKLQTAEVLAPERLATQLREFDELIKQVKRVSDAIQSRIPVADLKVIQTLSGITGRNLPDLSKLGDAVDQMVQKLTAKGGEAAFNLEPGSFRQLKQNVDKLIQSTKPSGTKTLVEQLDSLAKETAKQALSGILSKNDPFLPGNKSPAAAAKFYSSKYREHLDDAITPSRSEVVTAGPWRNVVSFGSVFAKIASEAVLRQDTCDELQVIFYCLNDSCGPVSGQSIAEFPLDADRLEYEYANAMKLNGKITLENFLRIIIDTQVTDKRAVAYGMTPAFEKWSPEKQQIANDQKNYDNSMLEWHSKYGSFTQPLIEMFVESGVEGGETGNKLKRLSVSSKNRAAADRSTRVIKRIHIYDVNASPFNGLQRILRVGDSFIFGDVKPPEKLVKGSDWFKEYIQNKTAALKKMESSLLVDQLLQVTEKVPGYEQYSVKSNSRELMQHVSSFAPSIRIGSNGSMVINASLASKTNGLDSAANIIKQNAAYAGQGGVLPPTNGLEDPNGMPLRMAPAQLTLQTVGCPIAAAYQQYFIDLGTGTTLDNLYTCTSVKHTISPGKFTSDWTFLYTDAYGKFAGAPSIVAAATKQIQLIADEAERSSKNAKNDPSHLGKQSLKATPPATKPAAKPPAPAAAK